MKLPVTTRQNGLHGYYLVPPVNAAFYDVLSGDYLEAALLSPGNPRSYDPFANQDEESEDFQDYVERPSEDQELEAWSDAELAEIIKPQTESTASPEKGNTTHTKAAPETAPEANAKPLPRAIRSNPGWLPDTILEQGLTRL
jgi:hypothetical protein